MKRGTFILSAPALLPLSILAKIKRNIFMRTDKEFNIKESRELEIITSSTSSHTDFDFYIGKWNIRNRKLKERLNNYNEWTEFNSTNDTTHLLKGFANMNKFSATFYGQPFKELQYDFLIRRFS